MVLPLHHLFINLFNIYLLRAALPWTEDKIVNKRGGERTCSKEEARKCSFPSLAIEWNCHANKIIIQSC